MRWRPHRTPSLALRLALAFSLSIIIVAAAYLAVQMILGHRFANFVTAESLKGQTHDIADAIVVAYPGARPEVRLTGTDAFGFDAFFANLKYRVLEADGTVLASSDGSLDSLLPSVPMAMQDGFYTHAVIDGVKFHVAAVRHRVADRQFLVQVGRSDRFAELAQQAIAPAVNEAVGIIAVIAILVLSVLSFLGIRSVLHPIRRASDAARSVGQSNLAARLPVDGVPAEIRPLVVAVNEVLDRLEVAFDSQQRFFANAAHELKTPIALLRGQLEGADHAVSAQALRDVDAIARTVGQLLHIAEVSGGRHLQLKQVELVGLARQVAGFLYWRAERACVSIHILCDQRAVTITADEGELFVLLKNLVENAIDFSPAGGTVRIHLGADRMQVDDEGPGVPEEHRQKIFERFWRSAQGDRPGSGLGLAIVQEVAAAHGWDVGCRANAAGGASLEVVFGGNRSGGDAGADDPARRASAEARA